MVEKLKQKDNFEIHIHNQKQWNEFKKYAQKEKKDPKILLEEIQNEMIQEWIMKESEKWHFGPKTVRYFRAIKAEWLSTKAENKDTIDKAQKNLDNLNQQTKQKIVKTVENTRSSLFWSNPLIHGSISVEYENTSRSKASKVKEDNIYNYGRPWPIENYKNEFDIMLWQLTHELTNEDATLLYAKFESDRTWKPIINVLAEHMKWASENEKIKLLTNIWAHMWDHYNTPMLNNADLSDVKSKKIWDSLFIKNAVWWVCRHIHDEIAQLADKLWITAWTITTNTEWWTRHVITIWKRKNGKFFIIDYGNYYEADNFLDLKDHYLAEKWNLDFKEWIAAPGWKIIKAIQTELEKKYGEYAASTWTQNSMKKSKWYAQNGLKFMEWVNIKTKFGKNEKHADISIANQNTKIWLSYNETGWFSRVDKYTSLGLYAEKFWWNSENWQFFMWWKIAYHNIKWLNGNERTMYTLWLHAWYNKELYKDDKNKVTFSSIVQWWLQYDPKAEKFAIQDGFFNGWATVNWKHIINKNWSTNLYGSLWFDVAPENVRDDRFSKMKAFWKYEVWWWVMYQDNDFIARLNAHYWRWPSYTEKGISWSIKKWKTELYAKYNRKKDTSFLHLPGTTSKEVWVKYNINDSFKAYIKYGDENNNWQKQKKLSAGVTYNF